MDVSIHSIKYVNNFHRADVLLIPSLRVYFVHDDEKITEGGNMCNRRALDEEQVLRENPDSYRLSCITAVYGDVSVKVQCPVGAAQWTR